MTPISYELTFDPSLSPIACDALAAHTGLSKSRIKQAMIKGAVWLRRPNTKMRRLRKATALLKPGDRLSFHYDPKILAATPPSAVCVRDMGHYTIWHKPAGLMTQGTRYGDHCALSRQVERHFQMRRDVFLIHRIDREVSGLVIVGHSRTAAAKLSALLRENRIEKTYALWVLGDLRRYAAEGRIDIDLDGKRSLTFFHTIRFDPAKNQTLVHARIGTGRLHQIRRHMAHIGFPILGDPRYGKGNQWPEGLQLAAFHIAMECPFGNGRVEAAIQIRGFDP